MQTLTILLMFVLAAAPSQRIETQFPDRAKSHSRRDRDESSHGHRTWPNRSRLPLPAARCSRSNAGTTRCSFSLLEEGASTNLFVWTASGRWSYELVPAASPATMHFAIDQQVVANLTELKSMAPSEPIRLRIPTSSQSFAEEMLLFAKPIRNLGVTFRPTEVGAFITDVYRKDDQLFIRYVIDNRTTRPFAIWHSRSVRARVGAVGNFLTCIPVFAGRSGHRARKYAARGRYGSRQSTAKCRRIRFRRARRQPES